MSQIALEGAGIRAGRWEAELLAEGAAPALEVWHRETALEGVEVAPGSAPGRWSVAVPIPATLLSDGVQTFLVREAGSGATIGHFTIITGEPLEDDIRAELDLVRAELDLLKRAFRRHCAGTTGEQPDA